MKIDTAILQKTIARICQPGKGILAADESSGTIKKRFDSIEIENTEENRKVYRNMLFTTEGFEECISGIILFDETVDQKSENGQMFAQFIASKGIVPGIKSDSGKKDHPLFLPQTLTYGLDDLSDRLQDWSHRSAGTLGFTKWRQVILVDPNPSQDFLDEAMDTLAKNALISQEEGYIPITEPEVLMEGSHPIRQCADVTERTLKTLYKKLEENNVSIPHTLLKPNMVLSGKELKKDTPEEVAHATLSVFRNTLPQDLPGIVFLSGGQDSKQATMNLDAINKAAKIEGDPWFISFSYGRALQDEALRIWHGKKENIVDAKKAFIKRVRLNGLAQKGEYSEAMEELDHST